MRDNQDIKDQIKKIRDLQINNNQIVKEQINQIKKSYLIEQAIEDTENITTRYNVPTGVEDSIQSDVESKKNKSNDAQQSYRISGGILVLHGETKKDTELTTDDKIAFQETMDEFVSEVSDLVNFEQLNMYSQNVDWSGKIVDFDIDFYFTIGENNGMYISGDMVKVDENFLDVIQKLQTYYEKFKSKWAKIIAGRKKTKPAGE
jgi:hypothetical protein